MRRLEGKKREKEDYWEQLSRKCVGTNEDRIGGRNENDREGMEMEGMKIIENKRGNGMVLMNINGGGK